MVIQEIDKVKFRLRTPRDLTWIKKYGTVFSVIDATGSGCICFGVEDENDRYFIKVAGVILWMRKSRRRSRWKS